VRYVRNARYGNGGGTARTQTNPAECNCVDYNLGDPDPEQRCDRGSSSGRASSSIEPVRHGLSIGGWGTEDLQELPLYYRSFRERCPADSVEPKPAPSQPHVAPRKDVPATTRSGDRKWINAPGTRCSPRAVLVVDRKSNAAPYSLVDGANAGAASPSNASRLRADPHAVGDAGNLASLSCVHRTKELVQCIAAVKSEGKMRVGAQCDSDRCNLRARQRHLWQRLDRDSVATTASILPGDGSARGLERRYVSFDRARGDFHTLGEPLGRTPRAPASAKLLGDRVESVSAVHER